MTNYFSSDLTFLELQNLVLTELREPVSTGSEGVSVDQVEDVINMVYSEAFNDQRMKQSARENDISFNLANDTTLSADAAAAAITLSLTDSSTFRSSGLALLTSDFITYTANAANTLTGVTGCTIAHTSGDTVRQVYPLSSIASDIDSEQVQYIDVDGIPQQFMGYQNLIGAVNYHPNSYAVYKGNLIFSQSATSGESTVLPKVLMIYTQKVTPLSATTDKPALIPNSWRVPILVYGACMKIAAGDAFRTGWDWWAKEYEKALSQYIAFKNTRVKDVSNTRRPMLGNSFLMR